MHRQESNDFEMVLRATDVARQQITAAGGQLSSASRQRRLAPLDQRDAQEKVTISDLSKTKALRCFTKCSRLQDIRSPQDGREHRHSVDR